MEILTHIFNTVFLFYQRPFCPEWDEKLSNIIKNCEVVEAGSCTITFRTSSGLIEVWTANKWYAFGHINGLNGKSVESSNQRRPKFSTMRKLNELYSKIIEENLNQEYQKLMGDLNG